MRSIAHRFFDLLKVDLYTKILVVVVVLAVFMKVGGSIWGWIFSQADPAAWFQAIGSLVGILIAIAVPMSQRRLERFDREKIQKQEERAIGIACFEQLDDIRSKISEANASAKEFMNSPNQLKIHQGDISRIELSIPMGSSFRAIEEDWNRFKVAPECLQLLIHEVKDYNWKIARFRNSINTLEDIEIGNFCLECHRSLMRTEIAQQKALTYFLKIL